MKSKSDVLLGVIIVFSLGWYYYCGSLKGKEPSQFDFNIVDYGDVWIVETEVCEPQPDDAADCYIVEVTDELNSYEDAENEIKKIVLAGSYKNKHDYLKLRKLGDFGIELIRIGIPILLGILWYKFFKKREG